MKITKTDFQESGIAPAINVEPRDRGELLLSCPYPEGDVPRSIAHLLLEGAQRHPNRSLVAELDGRGQWNHLTYADAVARCRQVAQWLINRGASEDRPLAILSGNSQRHFLMAWGAIFARVPYVPVSVAYSTVEGAHPKLASVLDVVKPAFVFAEDLSAHAPALDDIGFDTSGVELVSAGVNEDYPCTAWDEVISTRATNAVDRSIEQIDHDTVTRYMFTSGSTGMPKGVIYTHGMSCHMLASSAGLRPPQPQHLKEEAPPESRILEWMPWSHVGAGVMRMAGMINSGATVYLDIGRPVPEEFSKTVENLRTAKPTSYSGAPLGWAMLADALEADESLAEVFFANVRTMGFGSAAMPRSLAARLVALTGKYGVRRIPMGTSLASTEVATCLSRYWDCDEPDVIGLPMPGVEIRLLPLGGITGGKPELKYELRVRSKGVTPGYIHDPENTEAAFDEEGFFKMGDAVRLKDPDDPEKGLVFAGRVAEEFKLRSGTWVSAGTLRAEAVAAASPYVRDVVVCGLNEIYVALLVWPNLEGCAKLTGTSDPEDVAASVAVRQAIAAGLSEHNRTNPGSSRRIERFLLLARPPDTFEITEKGYVNQGEVQRQRAAEVTRLFDNPLAAGVMALSPLRQN